MSNKTSLQVIPVSIDHDVQPGENIAVLILASSKLAINDGDVIVISQKIISKQESRTVNLNMVIPSELAIGIASEYQKDPKLVEVILSESNRIVRMNNGVLITESYHGFICANAGVDESNVEKGYATLLPKDPDRSASNIRKKIFDMTGKKVAVLISDTFGRPFRLGQTDHAIGVSGMESILSYEGKHDTFGKTLRVTAISSVDELCAAAELVTGKTTKCPAAIIRNFKFIPNNGNVISMLRDEKEDLFR